MVINNAGNVFKLCISTKKKTKALQLVKIKEKACAVDLRVIFHINNIINDSWQLKCKFMPNLTTCAPNYTQIYFPYSTVTSACHGSGLACSHNITIFRTLMYMQTRFRAQKNV